MSDVAALFRYPTFSTLLTSTNFFLLIQFYTPLAAFLRRYPMTLASLKLWVVSGSSGSPLQLHSVGSIVIHAGKSLLHFQHQYLSLVMEEESITTFFCPWVERQNHVAKPSKFFCLLSLEHSLCFSIVSSPAFYSGWFPLLPKLSCPESGSVDQAGLKLKYSTAFPLECWD